MSTNDSNVPKTSRELRKEIERQAWRLTRLKALLDLASQNPEHGPCDDSNGNMIDLQDAFEHISDTIGSVRERLFDLSNEPARTPPTPGTRKRKPTPLSVVRTEAA